jgi:hypothetical protein
VWLCCSCQARLDLEVQRLRGDLSAAHRQVELVAADLAAEKDRTSATAAALERKVMHKPALSTPMSSIFLNHAG